jgi:hypothetical protein
MTAAGTAAAPQHGPEQDARGDHLLEDLLDAELLGDLQQGPGDDPGVVAVEQPGDRP